MFNLFRSAPSMPPPEIVAKVASGDMVLIDIRDPSEIAMTGKAEGALEIPLSTLRMRADPRSPDCHQALSCDRPVALYCASGARSGMAAGLLRRMGYGQVYNLGNLLNWQRAGGRMARSARS